MDFGENGLRDTLEALQKGNIKWTGAGSDKNASQEPLLYEFCRSGSNLKLAFISAYQFVRHYEDEFAFYSGETRWGVNNINTVRLKAQVQDLKKGGFFVIVSPHWGENYCFRNTRQKTLAKRIINNIIVKGYDDFPEKFLKNHHLTPCK